MRGSKNVRINPSRETDQRKHMLKHSRKLKRGCHFYVPPCSLLPSGEILLGLWAFSRIEISSRLQKRVESGIYHNYRFYLHVMNIKCRLIRKAI